MHPALAGADQGYPTVARFVRIANGAVAQETTADRLLQGPQVHRWRLVLPTGRQQHVPGPEARPIGDSGGEATCPPFQPADLAGHDRRP